MRVLLNYNFNQQDILDMDFEQLYTKRRRDSCFAFVFEKDGEIYALRDHFGIVPLFFRREKVGARFAITLTPLVDTNCRLSLEGLRYFLAFGSVRLRPLFDQIGIVPPGSVIRLQQTTGDITLIYRYHAKPVELYSQSLADCVAELDRLLLQALERTIRNDSVGLYLSGGVDSAIAGIYLHRLGIGVNAYTSAPWGESSPEVGFSRVNAEKIQTRRHYIDVLVPSRYREFLYAIPRLWEMPHGTSTSIGVASLWASTPIASETQIYGCQGSDTISCSVPAQSRIWFAHLFPKVLRHRLSKFLYSNDIVDDYLSFFSRGFVGFCSEAELPYINVVRGKIAQLSLAGLYLAHTPSDGEVLTGPIFKSGILFSNPFYDVDVVEFILGLPVQYRIAFSRAEKTGFYLDKRVVRRLAEQYLPRELVYRKKGFMVPLRRSSQVLAMFQDLPKMILGLPITLDEQRFRLLVLRIYHEFAGDEKALAQL